jgi:monoamine oxidase
MREVDVVVVGAGAAGVAAARRLQAERLSVLLVEARNRIGGRAWTVRHDGWPLDLGCGWLHSADENEWVTVAGEVGFAIDPTPPPWSRRASQLNFSAAAQNEFAAAWDRFDARIAVAAKDKADRPARDCLEPGGRWNALLDALSTYINGIELEGLSVHDFVHYRNTGVNWRVEQGYGALIEACAQNLDVVRDCPATLIDHAGKRVRVETPLGPIAARAAIIAVPASVIACEALRFAPALPGKVEAAAALPLGLADKVFLRVDRPDDLPVQTRLFGAIDRTATGSYHLRPFGSALIEGYFGGKLARELEQREGAFARFAIDQLAAHFGGDFRKRVTPIAASAWGRDPFARGSYSYARIGRSGARAALAAPVDERLFFAGEACSLDSYSTAHGAYRTGVTAAEAALQAVAAKA